MVVRDGKTVNIDTKDIVLDDIIIFSRGDQISVDSIVLNGQVEVNESLLTGEVDSIIKKKGDILLSGSFIVSGKCFAKSERVGNNSYAMKITLEARKSKKSNSELMNSLNKMLKYIAIVIIPIGISLFIKQRYILGSDFKLSVVSTVAAIIGMIPEGLYLLTTIALAVSIIRLGKDKILVRDLYCIETLARVDTLCLDKTGTITEGKMHVKEVVSLNEDKFNKIYINKIVGAIVSNLDDDNPTFIALKENFRENPNWSTDKVLPFSSERKYSAVKFKNNATYIIGAPEIILRDKYKDIRKKVETYSLKGSRVLIVVRHEGNCIDDIYSGEVENVALIIIEDKIREYVDETFKFFKEQNVSIKIISGDNPTTVSNIAYKAGVKDSNKYIDVSNLDTYEDIEKIVSDYIIFGRVNPKQKKYIIDALKKQGHTVAMTGDGVNDILALKEADCSIAMANGSDASRRVSQIVLTNSNFKSIPSIVNEGRRVINNIEKSASLFLVKTIYSFILALVFLFIKKPYPFVPIQLTLISALTVGIPSFFFTLEKNHNIIKRNFLKNIIKRASIGAITIVINILIIVYLADKMRIDQVQVSSMCALITGYTGLLILYKISKPFNIKRKLLFILIVSIFYLAVIFLGDIFMIYPLRIKEYIILSILMVLAYLLMLLVEKVFDYFKV